MLKWLHNFFGGQKDEQVEVSYEASVVIEEAHDEPRPVDSQPEAIDVVGHGEEDRPSDNVVVATRGADEPVVGSEFVDTIVTDEPLAGLVGSEGDPVSDGEPDVSEVREPERDDTLPESSVGTETGRAYFNGAFIGGGKTNKRRPPYRSDKRQHGARYGDGV